MGLRGVCVATVALVAAAAALAQAAPETAAPCPGVPASVSGAPAEEFEIACDAAREALAFFAPLNLKLLPALTIELAAALPANAPGDALGAYVVATRRIIVLRYEPLAGRGNWFGLPVDKRVYRGVIAHEVAHAIASAHAGETRLAWAAQEYLAYVTMIATLPEEQRRELLALHPGGGFDEVGQINEFVHAFNPGQFAVDSYRHWMRQPDPQAYLRRVLDGHEIEGLRGS